LQDNRSRVSFVSLTSSYTVIFVESLGSHLKVIPFNCIAHPFRALSFAWLGRARARARSELGRFSIKAQLFRERNGRFNFLPDEFGDPPNLKNFSLFNFEIFWLIHYYSQILGVSLKPCRRSICPLFHWFYFYGNFKTFYCNVVLIP